MDTGKDRCPRHVVSRRAGRRKCSSFPPSCVCRFSPSRPGSFAESEADGSPQEAKGLAQSVVKKPDVAEVHQPGVIHLELKNGRSGIDLCDEEQVQSLAALAWRRGVVQR